MIRAETLAWPSAPSAKPTSRSTSTTWTRARSSAAPSAGSSWGSSGWRRCSSTWRRRTRRIGANEPRGEPRREARGARADPARDGLCGRGLFGRGRRGVAGTADSESLAGEQRELALELARRFGFAHRVIRTSETQDPLYIRNDADRCYHCKRELFRHLKPLAEAEGYAHVAYGLILDDLSDFRPGQRAAAEAAARAPLAEAGLS